MNLWNILLWCVFGLLAGVVAKFIGDRGQRTDPAGIVLTIVLGIAGAVIGGWISSLIFGWNLAEFSLVGFVVAVLGALLLLFLYRMVMTARRRTL
jgi:uncharacterized membrane protein YeaQ/YmgE (transglycosylase-associated protein family)